MIRAAIIAISMAGCAGCPPHRVLEHSHLQAELGRSCAETCSPGRCDSSYDIEAQAEIQCDQDAKRFALCICRAP